MHYAASPKHSKHKIFLIFALLSICFITIVVAISGFPVHTIEKIPPPVDANAPIQGPEKPKATTSEPAPVAPEKPSTSAPEPPAKTITGNLAEPIPANTPVDDSYFEDALFIGNSITEGIQAFGIIKNTTVYASTGITVSEIFKKQIVKTPNGKITVLDALSKNKFGKIYLMLGMNELGWRAQDVFIQKYETLLGEIHRLQPDAILYVSSILPVSEKRDETDQTFNNTRVKLFNDCIRNVCADTSVNFLDCAQAVMGTDGKMPSEDSPDGIHMNKKTYGKWYEYIKSHTV